MTDDNTRPISVAELLARNGTIGSPPVSGHRRRKRRNAVSVADLTGEIPIVSDEEATSGPEDTESSETVVVYSPATETEIVENPDESDIGEHAGYAETAAYTVVGESAETTEYITAAEYAEDAETQEDTLAEDSGATDYTDAPDYTPDYADTTDAEPAGNTVSDVIEESAVVVETPEAVVATEGVEYAEAADGDGDAGYSETVETVERDEAVGAAEVPAPQPVVAAPPRSRIPLPRRRRGPERSHDPRPQRRSSGAEQMTYDPVDEAVDLAELVADQAPPAEELRSYLRSSTGTLFSGETVADDLARRGLVSETDDHGDEDYASADVAAPRRSALSTVGDSVVAVVQSLFAVVFGAGLFIAFDQLWRWNNVVALALSTLVIVALVVGVHLVRKTEDFVSILIAVAVGILVTFGPLALQST